MRRTSFADMPCPIARALNVVGEWWTLLILREAFLGARRFDDFQARLGIARKILAARLKALVAQGVLERRPLPDEGVRRLEYRLTDKGLALHPILMALADWGNRFSEDGPTLSFETRSAAEPVRLLAVNVTTGQPVDLRDLAIRLTPES